jgi:hypothetical protein
MPIKLREFYWRELLKTKDAEAGVYEKAMNSNTTSKTARRR